jgi:hypothetical protein
MTVCCNGKNLSNVNEKYNINIFFPLIVRHKKVYSNFNFILSKCS